MATLRELKGRIGSVASSEKITGAMKMISSAKMHKAEGALRRLVPFRSQIETIIANLLSSDAEFSSPLVTAPPETRHLLFLVWGSDDGLCGAYNVNIYKLAVARLCELRERFPQAEITVCPIGGKLQKACRRLRMHNVTVADSPLAMGYGAIDSKSEGTDVNDFTDMLVRDFLEGKTDNVEVLYMNYISAGRQRPKAQQLLPVLAETFGSNGAESGHPYIFEPGPGAIFNAVLPMFLMSAMQDIFIENRSSEQAARVMAMQAANDNAKTLLDSLQLEYNKLRQQSITSELLDIVGGQVRE